MINHDKKITKNKKVDVGVVTATVTAIVTALLLLLSGVDVVVIGDSFVILVMLYY